MAHLQILAPQKVIINNTTNVYVQTFKVLYAITFQGSEGKSDSDDNKSSKKVSKTKKDKTGGKVDKKSKSKSGSSESGQKDSQSTIRNDQPREDL